MVQTVGCFAAGTGKWHKMGLWVGAGRHFLQNQDGGEWSNDSTHGATPQVATNGDVCSATCHSL